MPIRRATPAPQKLIRVRFTSGSGALRHAGPVRVVDASRGVALRRFSHAVLASFLGAAVVAADPAFAQTCFTLQAELSHLQSQGGGGGRERYERAWREQADVLARTEARARDAGCFGGGFVFFRREPNRTCRTLVPKLQEMENNLVRLDRLRRRGGGGNARRIRAIQGMMADRACGSGEVKQARRRENDRVFRGNDPYAGRGTFRTLCVRTCDGYYFPISFSTTRQQFANDAQTCSAMCPGAAAELYVHANPGGSPQDMVSLTNQPYSSLDTAFRYRTNLDPSCSCKPAGGYSVAAVDPNDRPALDPAADATPPLPRPRREPGEDPETLANRDGSFLPRIDAGTGVASAAEAVSASGSPIRVVGPTVGSTPEQEGVILTPVPN
jgi:hypothetical protein